MDKKEPIKLENGKVRYQLEANSVKIKTKPTLNQTKK